MTQKEPDPEAAPSLVHRAVHAGFNGLAFGLCYLLANQFAASRGTTRHVASGVDAQIPFIPWMVLPYLSSGLFFALAFFAVPGRDGLRVLSQRMLIATVVAGLVFVFWPLRFATPRPPVEPAFLAALYGLLDALDQPFNQLPSLHVAFCLVWWAALRPAAGRPWQRVLLAAWLGLTAASALFTHQHHLADVLAGLVLGLTCLALVRPSEGTAAEPDVALYYWLAGAAALVIGTALLMPIWLSAYAVASLWLVALAYRRGDRFFLHKRGGGHPWWTWALYAPYLAGYRLTWLASAWHGRGAPQALAPGLWIGRRLGRRETARLPAGCTVIDLSAELPETPALRRAPYRHFPLLDIVAPPAAAVQEIVAAVREELAAGRPVYLHCAMGRRRCLVIARAALAT